MKKFFTLVGLMLCAIVSFADVTTNHPTISAVSINPGGADVAITVSVENISEYCAFGLDIYLPEGYEFVQKELENADEELELMYASKGAANKTSHVFDSALQANGCLRVSSFASATYKTSSDEIFTFWVKANSWVKPGNATITIKDCSFTKTDQSEDQSEDQSISDKVTVTTACTLPIPAGWSTCVFPFTPASLSGIKVYDIAGVDGTTVKLKEATSIGDYKPYIVKADAETSLEGTIEATYPTGVKTNGLLNGVVTATEITSDYVLQNQGEGEGFYKVNSEKAITVPMGKAYLSASASPAKDNVLLIEVPTAINNVEAAADNDNVYNLNGVKVSTPQRGIYIKGGKKVVMK